AAGVLRMKLVTEAMSDNPLAFDVPRVVAVRIGLRDPTVAIVNLELGPRVAAHRPAAVDGLALGLEMPAGPIGPAAADVPAARRVGHHVVGAGSALIASH